MLVQPPSTAYHRPDLAAILLCSFSLYKPRRKTSLIRRVSMEGGPVSWTPFVLIVQVRCSREGGRRRGSRRCLPGSRRQPGKHAASRHALRAAFQVQVILAARAHAGASPRPRNALFAPVSTREKLALEQGVVAQAACGLTNARASEPSSSLGKQFKQNRSGGAPKGASRCSDFSQRRRGRGRTRVCYAVDPRDPTSRSMSDVSEGPGIEV